VVHNNSKHCVNCGILFKPRVSKTIYCCIKCAVETRNKSKEYLDKLSKKTKERWQDDDYKKRISVLIKESLNNE